MSNNNNFQPLLEGPGQVGATVAKKEYGKSIFSYLGNAVESGVNISSSIIGDLKEQQKTQKAELKTQTMNEYAAEISNVKSAYDQKKISLTDLDIQTRAITDKYYSQNRVNAKDLNSIRDGVLGVDVSGQRLQADLEAEKAQQQRLINQKNTLIDNWRKDNPAYASASDEFVMSEIRKSENITANLLNALAQNAEAITANDTANVKSTEDAVLKAATDSESFNVYRGIVNGTQIAGPEAVFTQEAYEINKNLILKRLIDAGVPAAVATRATNNVLEMTGYKTMVDDIRQGIINVKEWDENASQALLAAAKKNLYLKAPEAMALSVLPPETVNMVLANTDLLTAIQQKIPSIFKEEIVDNSNDPTATKGFGMFLQSAIKGEVTKQPAGRLTSYITGAVNVNSQPADVSNLTADEIQVTEDNTKVLSKAVFDERLQNKIAKEGTPEQKEALKKSQKTVLNTEAQLLRHSKDTAQWDENIVYDAKKGRYVMTKPKGGAGILQTLASPYSATITENLNNTLDKIDSSSVLSDREKESIKEEFISFIGARERQEGEVASGLGGLTGRQIGQQFVESGKEFVNVTKEIVQAPAEAITEGFLNILDPDYTGSVEEAVQTVYEALPEELKTDAESFFKSLTSTETPVMKELKKIALNPLVEFGKEIVKNPLMSGEEWDYKYGKEGVVTKAYKQAWEDVKEGVKVVVDYIKDKFEEPTQYEKKQVKAFEEEQRRRGKKLIEEAKKRK